MSSHEALIHCSCTAPFSVSRPPPSDPPLALFQHHSLSDLLFCEDCDAVRCNSCAACEVACYYCPNCLFEVPSASVRGEKNRCVSSRRTVQGIKLTARFGSTDVHATAFSVLSATTPSLSSHPTPTRPSRSTRPPRASASRLTSSPARSADGTRRRSGSSLRSRQGWLVRCVPSLVKQRPVELNLSFLSCTAVQLQKAEEPTADLLEFDHIKDHLEPYLRRSQAQSSSSTHAPGASSSSAVLSAASAQLFKDIPGLGARYGGTGSLFGTSSRARGGADAGQAADELERYSSLYPSRGGGPGSEKENRRTRVAGKGKAVDRDAELLERMREMTDMEEVASLDRRWTAGWQPPVLSKCVTSVCRSEIAC